MESNIALNNWIKYDFHLFEATINALVDWKFWCFGIEWLADYSTAFIWDVELWLHHLNAHLLHFNNINVFHVSHRIQLHVQSQRLITFKYFLCHLNFSSSYTFSFNLWYLHVNRIHLIRLCGEFCSIFFWVFSTFFWQCRYKFEMCVFRSFESHHAR